MDSLLTRFRKWLGFGPTWIWLSDVNGDPIRNPELYEALRHSPRRSSCLIVFFVLMLACTGTCVGTAGAYRLIRPPVQTEVPVPIIPTPISMEMP